MMKNLFKNLMLVAVAAMAFTACQNDNGEMDMLVKKTIINGVATIDNDDTRSGFVGSETTENEDGTTTTTYKSAWDGGETIKLYINYGAAETTATVDAEGKFTAEFEGDFAESCTISACSPAGAWSSEYSFTIPAVQTPRTDSVDPAAHILKAQSITVTNGSANFKMQHEVAYGKMTVNTPAEFVIDHVDIELNGAWYGYAKSLSYTINADNVEDNTFWFATDVIEVSEMTVTAYDADGKAYTKTVTMNEEKTLKFQYYKVSTFSVSNLTEQEEVYDYTTAYVSRTWGSTDKLITFTAEGKDNMNVNFAGRSFDGNAIAAGTYTYGDGVYSYGINFGDYSNAKVSIATMGSAVVSIVDGRYIMEFNNLKDYNGNLVAERITFKGTIDGLDIPDPRQALDMPNVESSISGKTITLSWEAIENAEGYYIECTSSNDIEPISTTETTVTITVPSFSYYAFSVRAVVSEDNETYRSSDAAYVEYYDPRPYLPTPTNVTATVDGANATISWASVEGADGYQVSYYLDGQGQVYVDVEGTSITLELGYDISNLWVYVFSIANDDNPDYRSSNSWDASVVVNTEKDPDKFVDYQYATLSWNNSYSRFELTGNGYDMTQFYLNSSDSPNNNSIKPGTYTYAGNTVSNPAVGKFSLRYILGSGAGSSHYVNDASMSVTIEDGQYCIVITIISAGNGNIVGKTFGYKGLPDGFVLPSEGGDSGDDNTGDGGEEDGFIQMTKLYYDSSALNIHNFIMSDADGSNKITISFNNNDVLQTWIPVYEYTSKSLTAVNGNTGYCSLQYDKAKINGTSYDLNATGHTLKVLSSSNGGNHEIELYVVTSGGDEYKFKFSGNLGL